MLDSVGRRIYEKEETISVTSQVTLSGVKPPFEAASLRGCIVADQAGTVLIQQLAFSTNVVVKETSITLVADTPQTIGPVDIFGDRIVIKATMTVAPAALKTRIYGR